MAGSAFNLHDDLAGAWRCWPGAPVVAVNGAAREVRALALFSAHPERFVAKGFEWIRHQRRLFGEGFTVHGGRYRDGCPHVDYWWGPMSGGGGSAWGARKLAWMMGFDPVILCGCPLVPGNYAGHRPGQIMTRAEVTEQYASEIEADKEWHEGCFSMSGRTKDILGLPPPASASQAASTSKPTSSGCGAR